MASPKLQQWPQKKWLNSLITGSSAVLCLMLTLTRFPGMELMGIGPNWPLIWVVAWSLKRSAGRGAIAGLTLGLMQDSLTASYPTHTIGLVLVGFLSARLQKSRYIQEDFISVALIVFGAAIMAESAIALQAAIGGRAWVDVWQEYQQLVLASAILSSLWAPVLYYPLNLWWQSQASQRRPKIKI